MNFILVSLLLGVRVPSDEKLWQNGSEYTFDAIIRTISNFTPPYTDQREYMGSIMSTTLKCRSKEPGRLQCRYEDVKITKFSSNIFKTDAVVPFKGATYQEFDFRNETIEMKFHDKGEEIFEEKMDRYNVIARIRSVKKVQKLKNSSIGECFVCYELSQKNVDDRTNKGEFQFI